MKNANARLVLLPFHDLGSSPALHHLAVKAVQQTRTRPQRLQLPSQLRPQQYLDEEDFRGLIPESVVCRDRDGTPPIILG